MKRNCERYWTWVLYVIIHTISKLRFSYNRLLHSNTISSSRNITQLQHQHDNSLTCQEVVKKGGGGLFRCRCVDAGRLVKVWRDISISLLVILISPHLWSSPTTSVAGYTYYSLELKEYTLLFDIIYICSSFVASKISNSKIREFEKRKIRKIRIIWFLCISIYIIYYSEECAVGEGRLHIQFMIYK